MIRAVMWDLGGVILRTFDRSGREHWERRLGLDPGHLGRIVFNGEVSKQATLGRASADDVWTAVLAQLGLPESERKPLVRSFFAGDAVDQELTAFIRSLRPAYKTGLITNAWGDLRHWLENEWHLADAFDVMVISAEVGLAKPDARIYRLALDGLGVAPEESVFIDDFEENVAGARAIEMHGIRFVSPEQTRRDLGRLLEVAV
jgi:epoxide hydrolase-like predicted phosphatase